MSQVVGGPHPGYRTARERVMAFLAAHIEDDWNAGSIAFHTGVGKSSIGQVIKRMRKANQIIQTKRGYYQHPAGLVRREVDPRIRFHGIKLETRCHERDTSCFLGMVRGWDTRLQSPANHIHPGNGSHVCYSDYQGRPVTITIHPKARLLEEWVSASSLPFHPLEFYAFGTWTEGWSGVPASLWKLVECGANIDQKDVTLDWGLSQISLADAQGRVMRAYQKAQDLLRVEVHDTPNLSMDAVYELMKDIARPVFTRPDSPRRMT